MWVVDLSCLRDAVFPLEALVDRMVMPAMDRTMSFIFCTLLLEFLHWCLPLLLRWLLWHGNGSYFCWRPVWCSRAGLVGGPWYCACCAQGPYSYQLWWFELGCGWSWTAKKKIQGGAQIFLEEVKYPQWLMRTSDLKLLKVVGAVLILWRTLWPCISSIIHGTVGVGILNRKQIAGETGRHSNPSKPIIDCVLL